MTFYSIPLIYKLLLSLQGSLLNTVLPQLRAVTVDVNPEQAELYVLFFYDGKITDELFDIANIASVEIEPFPLGYIVAGDSAIRLDYPKQIPIRGKLAFLRKEPMLPKFERENRTFLRKVAARPLDVFLLDMQQALLGKVTPCLRKVLVKLDSDQKKLSARFFYDGEISEEDFKLASSAICEAQISFPDYTMESCIARLDFPQKTGLSGYTAVYWRREIEYTSDGQIKPFFWPDRTNSQG